MSLCRMTVASVALAILVGCETEPERKYVFRFDGPDDSPLYERVSDPPLTGKDATYTVPARRQLLSYRQRYRAHDYAGYDPLFGPHQSTGSVHEQFVEPSPYFLERTGDPVLPDGERGVEMTAEVSHTTVPASGGVVWVRLNLAAPRLGSARETGLNLALVLDLSDATGGPGKAAAVRDAARVIGRQLLPQDRLAIVLAGPRVRILRETAAVESHDRIDQVLEVLRPQAGRKDLGGALTEAYAQVEHAAETGGGPGQVIVLSDGHVPDGAAWRLEDLASQKQDRRGIRTCAIGLGDDVDAACLAGLARSGEGRFAWVGSGSDAGRILGREMRSLLRTFADHLRLNVLGDGVRVLAVHGRGLRPSAPGARDLALSSLAAGEGRSILLRLKLPPESGQGFHQIGFQLYYTRVEPVRRTTRDVFVTVHAGKALDGEDRMVRIHSRLAAGLDLIQRALEEGNESYARSAVQMLETELPAWKATVYSEGDRPLMSQAALFEELAGRLQRLLSSPGLQRTSAERQRLLSELYHRYS